MSPSQPNSPVAVRFGSRLKTMCSYTEQPHSPKPPAPGLNALDVLGRICWVTTEPASEAQAFTKDSCDTRPLTEAEWNARLPDKSCRSHVILLHPNASSKGPACRSISVDSTVREILEHIEAMTVGHGDLAIADRVYFEGIARLSGEVYEVLVGS